MLSSPTWQACKLVFASTWYAPWFFLYPFPRPHSPFPLPGFRRPRSGVTLVLRLVLTTTRNRMYLPIPAIIQPEPEPPVPLPRPETHREPNKKRKRPCNAPSITPLPTTWENDRPAPPAPARSASRQPQRWYRGASWRSWGFTLPLFLFPDLWLRDMIRRCNITREHHEQRWGQASHPDLGPAAPSFKAPRANSRAQGRASLRRQLTGAVDR